MLFATDADSAVSQPASFMTKRVTCYPNFMNK